MQELILTFISAFAGAFLGAFLALRTAPKGKATKTQVRAPHARIQKPQACVGPDMQPAQFARVKREWLYGPKEGEH